MQVVIANENSEDRTRNRLDVSGLGMTCLAPDCVNFADLKFRLSQTPPVELVVVFVSPNNLAAGLDAIRAVRGFSIPVVAAGSSSDPQLIIQTTRLGAEFADAAKFVSDLEDVLERFRAAGTVALRRGHCVVVTAAGSGAGVTTVATNLAFAWGAKYANKVALAELSAGTPELALNLDLALAHTIADLCRDVDRLDAAMLDRAMSPAVAGVRVLASKQETLEAPVLSPATMRKVVVLLRTLFDRVTLDVGSGAAPAALEAMRLSEAVVVVSRIEVPSLRLTRKYINQLLDAGIPQNKLKLAMNRYGQSGQLDWKKAEAALPFPPDVWIPDDPGNVNSALNKGQAVAQYAGRSGVAKNITKLAQALDVHTNQRP